MSEDKRFCEMINDKEWVDYKFEYENNQRVMKDLYKQLDLYKEVIEEVRKSIEDYQEYIEEAKKMYSDLDDDNVVKASCMQLLNNQMARNYEVLQILEKVGVEDV